MNFSIFTHIVSQDHPNFLDKLPQEVLPNGAVIFEQGEHSTDVYFIIEGGTKSVTYGVDGKMAYFALRTKGDFFGYYSAITNAPRTANMVTVDHTVLARMKGEDFMCLLRSYPELSEYMLKHVMNLLRLETNRVTDLITLNVRARISAELLAIAEREGAYAFNIVKRCEFAARIGTTRETLSRNLSFLKKQGIIELQGDRLKILKPQALIANKES